MKNFELRNIDPEEFEELLLKVEDSFGIKFNEQELALNQTFGELCDQIKNKIQLEKTDDCTTQQAYYKLRKSFVKTLHISSDEINRNTPLKTQLPRPTRRKRTKEIEQELGFHLSLLRPSYFVTGLLAVLLFASFIAVFVNWPIGLTGLVISFLGLWIANRTANELEIKTVGQLATKMTREHYLRSRRNPKTYNENEIEKILIDWLNKDFGIKKSKLTRKAMLN